MKAFFSHTSHSITGAAILLGGASFVSRFIGLLRDRAFAHLFGAGDTLDVYYAAFRIPDFIYNLLIVGALAAGFIPVFTNLYGKNKDRAWEVTSAVITILGCLLAGVCIALFFAMPSLMPYLVPGFSETKVSDTILLSRILLLSPIILGVSGIVGSVLQSVKAFLVYSLSPILYNIGIIIGAFFFVPRLGISGLAWGVILGALLHVAVQLPFLTRLGFRYRPRWTVDRDVRHILLTMIPRALGLASAQISLVVTTVLASSIGSGNIAIFNFANNLQSFPVGIIGLSFAIAALPTLSALAEEKKETEMVAAIASTTRHIIFFIVPITIIVLLLRAQIVRVALGSGEFDWDATKATANVLAFFAFSLFAQCLIPLFARVFYARHDTWTPFFVGLFAQAVNVVASLLFIKQFGIVGLAFAFSLGMIVHIALLWILLRRALGTLQELQLLHLLYKISVAGLAMGLLTQWLKTPIANALGTETFVGVATQGMVAGLLGLLIYIGVGYILRTEELLHLQGSFTKRWLNFRNVKPTITEIE